MCYKNTNVYICVLCVDCNVYVRNYPYNNNYPCELASWQVGIWNSVALLVHDVLLLRISAVNKEWRTHTNTQLQTHNDDKDIYYLWDCFWGTLNCFTERLMGKNFQTENKQLSCSWDSWLFKKVLSLVSFFHASLIRFGIIVKWFHTNNVCV